MINVAPSPLHQWCFVPEQLRLISANLSALGARRLTMLALTAALTLGALASLGWWASQPATITLYSGLQRDDVNRIGPALSQAGISYDVSADGETVLVEPSNAGRARMILAEQGLPRSTGSGYELFETMGSLGLTSFMQQVTRVRALEGEISRSIRLVDGVRAARVHIVLPDRASFATRDRKASASVLLQTDSRMDESRADAIRHLVAAAVPGLDNEGVTILGASGRLLASGADPTSGSLTGKFAMQRMVEAQLTTNAVRVLEPWLGAENFRVSVQADLDTDESRTEETIFDPDSRVERSVQVVKTEETNSERAAASETSVGQDIPEEADSAASDGTASRQASERREETTNYEINSKKVATVRAGYAVTGLSASIVINRERLAALGTEPLSDEMLKTHLADARRSVLAAIGYDEARGDVVNVEALAFADTTMASASCNAADATTGHAGRWRGAGAGDGRCRRAGSAARLAACGSHGAGRWYTRRNRRPHRARAWQCATPTRSFGPNGRQPDSGGHREPAECRPVRTGTAARSGRQGRGARGGGVAQLVIH